MKPGDMVRYTGSGLVSGLEPLKIYKVLVVSGSAVAVDHNDMECWWYKDSFKLVRQEMHYKRISRRVHGV